MDSLHATKRDTGTAGVVKYPLDLYFIMIHIDSKGLKNVLTMLDNQLRKWE